MKTNEGMMEVSAIENGTVIDHIPTSALFKVIEILDLDKREVPVIIATNLKSNRIGKKALIKIVDRYCSDNDMSYLALVAPTARVSIIKNYEVSDKRQIVPPESVRGFVKCVNPMCITNHERVEKRFSVRVSGENNISLKCGYCEKVTMQEQIEIIRAK